MDFVNKFTGGDNKNPEDKPVQQEGQKEEGIGGFLGGITNKLNSAAGGGKESEKNEDYLDKGMPSSSIHVRDFPALELRSLSGITASRSPNQVEEWPVQRRGQHEN